MGKLMTRQAAKTIAVVAPYVRSKLALDQKVDLRKLLMGVTSATFTEDKPRILKGIKQLTQGKLARDASIGEVAELLDLIDSHGVEADETVGEAQHSAMEASAQGSPKLAAPKKETAPKGKDNDEAEEKKDMPKEGGGGLHNALHEHLKGKISDDDMDKVHEMLAAGGKTIDASEGEDEHEEDEDVDERSEEFHGGEGEDESEGHPGAKLKELGAETGEDEEYDLADKEQGSEAKQEQRDNSEEWRRGEKKNKPATDKKKFGKDKKHARDNPPPFKGKPKPGGGMDRRGAHDSRAVVTRSEMENGIEAAVKIVRDETAEIKLGIDSAVKAARDKERGIREAEKAVQPYVGNLSVTFDSAEAVYSHALRLLNVDVKGVHPSAYPAILRATQRSGNTTPRPKVAMDYARSTSYYERFPEARRIKVG